MRQKITVSLPISNKFGKSIRLLPEAQYFWSEYNYDNKEDLVMLGQKWIRRNELLKIDIKPNENIKVYEKLRNNLSYLKDSFGYKIKREDDETNIIRFYDNFMTMNEIFMLDIYNDLGLNYKPEPEEKRNLYDVYTNIYYPMITYERLETIIQLLNGKSDKETQLIESHFGHLMCKLLHHSQLPLTALSNLLFSFPLSYSFSIKVSIYGYQIYQIMYLSITFIMRILLKIMIIYTRYHLLFFLLQNQYQKKILSAFMGLLCFHEPKDIINLIIFWIIVFYH